jgi:5'-nucleotidase
VRILLTNDDGIDAPGLRALADDLKDLGEVAVLAPASNQSAVGRGLSYGRMGPDRDRSDGAIGHAAEGEQAFTARIPHADHELGYAIHGTPCDCVILGANVFEPDLVVAGCNPGANLGAYVLARSGTASAAIEAACLGVPGVALSMDTLGLDRSLGVEDFERACGVAKRVIERAVERAVFDGTESRANADGRTEDEPGANGIAALNVNVPRPDRPLAGMSITHPTPVYGMDARFEGGEFRLHNPLWAGMAAREILDSEGTDRRAILDNEVSISPLALPHAPIDDAVLSGLEDVFADVAD